MQQFLVNALFTLIGLAFLLFFITVNTGIAFIGISVFRSLLG